MKSTILSTVAALALILGLVLVSMPAEAAGPPYGMTWTKSTDYSSGALRVSCAGCDAYDGDTSCSIALPVLCIYVSGAPDPDPGLASFYNGWSEGFVTLSDPVTGSDLTSLADGDAVCSDQFGSGWRMAEFHDGDPDGNSAGWNFRAYGSVADLVRFWVYINDQNANCWNS